MSWQDSFQPDNVPTTSWQSSFKPDASGDTRLLADAPGYEYGNILPFKKETSTGNVSLAFPEMVRSPVRGFQDLETLAQNRSTDTTQDAVNAMLTLGTPALTSKAPLPEYDSAATHSAISDAYGKALKDAKPFYNYMNQTAEGKAIDASGMISPVKGMIADIESDPFHEGRTSLPRLKAIVTQIEENPNIPLSDAVSMKQEINSNFNPKRFDQGSKSPYFEFGQILDSKLQQAAKQFPEFGFAKTLADQNWVNNVAQPFTQNSVLQKFWKPDDFYAQRSIKSGLAESLPDATRQRAATLLDKVGDPVEMDAVTRPLPSDLASTFRRAVFQNITQGGGTGRLHSAGKAVGSLVNLAPWDTAKNTLHAIVGKEYSPEEIALMKASKMPSPSLNPYYQMTLQDLISRQAGGGI